MSFRSDKSIWEHSHSLSTGGCHCELTLFKDTQNQGLVKGKYGNMPRMDLWNKCKFGIRYSLFFKK